MCAPAVLAATALIQVGSAVAGHVAQKNASEENERSARRARIVETLAIGRRQVQEGVAASRQLGDVDLMEGQMEGSVQASAAEAGVSGGSVDALLGDIQGSGGRARQDIRDSYVATIDQLQLEKAGAKAREQSRINAVPEPSVLATGLRIGGVVTNYLTTRQQMNRTRDLADDGS